jgi:hypothetical protein
MANFAKFIWAIASSWKLTLPKFSEAGAASKKESCPMSEQNTFIKIFAVALALVMWCVLDLLFSYVVAIIAGLTYQNIPVGSRPVAAIVVFAAIATLCFGQFVRLAIRKTGNGSLGDIGQHIASALFGLVAGAFGSIIYLLSYHRAFFASAIYISDIASALCYC